MGDSMTMDCGDGLIVMGNTAQDLSQTQSKQNMDFLNSAQTFFDPITKPIRNAQAVVRQPITEAISESISKTGQISVEMNQFRERVVQDFTKLGNRASSIGDNASISIEKGISSIQAIGDNPELLTHVIPYPLEL